jgi:O-antigen/teichoic acid export membrane protein
VNRSLEDTRSTGRRGVAATLTGERLLTHNIIVATGTVSAGLLGVAFQAVVSHQFRPADYGSVFAVVTLMTFIGLPASAFTLLMARATSSALASGQKDLSASLLRRGNRTLLLLGGGLAALLAIASPLLGGFLDVPPQMVLLAAAAVPFAVASPLLMGVFQGEQLFLTYSTLSVGQAALKLAGAVALGLIFGPVGVIAGISLATALIYLAATWLLGRELSVRASQPWWRPASRYLAVVLPSTLALAVLLSADVFLVKHFFAPREAGQYAAVAALGRAIFWGASGVAAVLFPKIVFRSTQLRTGSHLVVVSLILVTLGGVIGIGLIWVASKWLLTLFAGVPYAGASAYLPMYAVGMTLLGGVAVLVAVHQSRGTPGFLAVLLPLTVLESALLIGFHHSLTQVVEVVDISMGLLLCSLAALYWGQERLKKPTYEGSIAAGQITQFEGSQ